MDNRCSFTYSQRRQHNHPHVYEKSLDREQTPDNDDDDDDAYDDGELDTIYSKNPHKRTPIFPSQAEMVLIYWVSSEKSD